MESAFNDFYFTGEENVTEKNFEKKIAEAMDYLKKMNDLESEPYKKIKQVSDYSYKAKGKQFSGQYVTYSVNNNAKIVANLNCFLSNENDYMEVQSWQ